MTRFIICTLLLAAGALTAQTAARVYPLEGAKALHLSANFASVELTTGGGGGVTVLHQVLINGEPRSGLTEVRVDREGGILRIEEVKPTMDQLDPAMRNTSTVIDGKVVSGKDNWNIKVRLVVTVPPGVDVTVETIYGSVRATDVAGLRRVRATYGAVEVVAAGKGGGAALDLYSNYGAVDLTLPAGYGADLELITEYGDLLTDVDLEIDTDRSEKRSFYERVVATLAGGGTDVKCRAPYGKVYLRRAK